MKSNSSAQVTGYYRLAQITCSCLMHFFLCLLMIGFSQPAFDHKNKNVCIL